MSTLCNLFLEGLRREKWPRKHQEILFSDSIYFFIFGFYHMIVGLYFECCPYMIIKSEYSLLDVTAKINGIKADTEPIPTGFRNQSNAI